MTIENGPPNLLGSEPQQHGTYTARLIGALKGVSGKRVAATLIETFTPEILHRRKTATKRIGPTAYLDGLRGAAAFCVVLMHLLTYTHDGVEICYGSLFYWGHHNNSLLSLPFIRVFVLGGHFAVQLFFVISGYVLPRRLIQLLHEGRRDDFIENAHSAMVRRPFRLFLPILWSTFAFAMSWHIFGLETPWPAHKANIFLEIVEWINESAKFVFFFRRGDLYTWYNIHSWTIPVELQGSMFIYLWLFLTHTIDTRRRVLLTLGMVLYLAIGAAGAWFAGFFAGMLTAELDMLAAEGNTLQIQFPWDSFRKWLNVHRWIKQTLLHVMLVFGLFLAGEPTGDNLKIKDIFDSCPGWYTLSRLIPPAYDDGKASTFRWFWLFWGAWMTLVAVKEINWVRWLFETRPSQCKLSLPTSPNQNMKLTSESGRSRQALVLVILRPRTDDRHPLGATVLPHSREGANGYRDLCALRPRVRPMARCRLVAVS